MAHNQHVDQFIGSGYDVFGKYASPESLKKRIFNIKYATKYTRSMSNVEINSTFVEGSCRTEYQKNLALEVAATAEYPMFPASVKVEFGLESLDLDYEENRLMSANFYKRLEVSKLESRLEKYMNKDARRDLKRAPPDDVIQHYGGYVVCGVVSGGRWSVNVLSNKLHHESATKLQAQLKAAAGPYVSGELSAGFEREIKKEEAYLEYNVRVVGGNTNYSSLDEINQWKESVTKSTAQVTDFAMKHGLVPIWEFVKDNSRRDQLKEAFERHAEKYMKQLPYGDRLPSILERTYDQQPMPDAISSGMGTSELLQLYSIPDSEGWKYVGHSNEGKVLALREKRPGYGILKKPVGWKKIWSCQKFLPSRHYSCWMPEAPAGYRALGVFCRFGVSGRARDEPPSDEETSNFVVVHNSCVEEHVFETPDVWTSEGSGAKYALTLGKLKHNTLWPYSSTNPHRPIRNIEENGQKMWYTLKTGRVDTDSCSTDQDFTDGVQSDQHTSVAYHTLDEAPPTTYRHADQECTPDSRMDLLHTWAKTHQLDLIRYMNQYTIYNNIFQDLTLNGHVYRHIADAHMDVEYTADPDSYYFDHCITIQIGMLLSSM